MRKIGRGAVVLAACAVLGAIVRSARRRSTGSRPALARFADGFPTIVWQASAAGTVTYFNARFADATASGACPDVDAAWFDAIHPDDVARARDLWKRAVGAGASYAVEYRLRSPGGYRTYAVRALPERDAAGSIVGWLGTCDDVEDRSQADLDLRALLEAGARFVPAIDARESYETIARVLVPSHADWALVAVLDDAGLPRVETLRHADSRMAARARAAVGTAFDPTGPLGEALAREAPDVRRDLSSSWTDPLQEPLRSTLAAFAATSTLGLPIRHGSRLAAVLVLGRTSDRSPFDDRNVPLFLELGRRLSLATDDVGDDDRRVAASFQRAALPAELPRHSRAVFDGRYVAGSSASLVCGDWYDAFLLVDGRIVVSVGDVSGSGLAAAVTMGMVRQSIRAAARIDPDPATIVDAADRTLRADDPGRIVTAFVGVFDPYANDFAYVGAGHPPALVRSSAGTIVELASTSPPLGEHDRQPHATTVVSLPAGYLLALYTDGLVGTTGDVARGERRLREALVSVDAMERPARALERAVREGAPRDDVAVLTMLVRESGAAVDGRTTRDWTFRAGDGEAAVAARHDFTQALRDAGVAVSRVPNAELVFGEIVANAVRHAAGRIDVRLEWNGRRPVLHVLDEGPGYRADAIERAGVYDERGRGLFLVTMLAEDFNVARRREGGSHSRAVLACEAPPR